MPRDDWRRLAAAQGGLLTRAQLAAVGVDRWAIRRWVASERWVERTPTVIGTTTGELSRGQLGWLGVLHGGPRALVSGLTAAELAGLRGWRREEVTIAVPQATDVGAGHPGIRFVRTRRDLGGWARRAPQPPAARIEPAVLLFAAEQRSARTAEGVLAATVQQRLPSSERLLDWVDRLRPLRGTDRFRRALQEIAGGAHSSAELDVRRICRAFGLALPSRQVRRRDSTGRVRYTDCEWCLADGRCLVLEVDGAFHLDVEHWEDDIARPGSRAGQGDGRVTPARTTQRGVTRRIRSLPLPLSVVT